MIRPPPSKIYPQRIIDKIQIYDEQSEQAQLTGFDDGETTKTINIILKPGMKEGKFGKNLRGLMVPMIATRQEEISISLTEISVSRLLGCRIISISKIFLPKIYWASSVGRGIAGVGVADEEEVAVAVVAVVVEGGSPSASASDFLVGQQDGITSANAGGINFSDKWGEKIEVAASYFFNQSDNVSTQLTDQEYFDTEGLNGDVRRTKHGGKFQHESSFFG